MRAPGFRRVLPRQRWSYFASTISLQMKEDEINRFPNIARRRRCHAGIHRLKKFECAAIAIVANDSEEMPCTVRILIELPTPSHGKNELSTLMGADIWSEQVGHLLNRPSSGNGHYF
jgi:hypothetical protein